MPSQEFRPETLTTFIRDSGQTSCSSQACAQRGKSPHAAGRLDPELYNRLEDCGGILEYPGTQPTGLPGDQPALRGLVSYHHCRLIGNFSDLVHRPLIPPWMSEAIELIFWFVQALWEFGGFMGSSFQEILTLSTCHVC